MALARLNLPSLSLYGGSIMPGRFHNHDVTIQDVFEAVGATAAGKMSETELKELEDRACPGAGACGGQFTANTMATAITFLGISPMGANEVPAVHPQKAQVAVDCGRKVMELYKRDIRPKQIMTSGAFQNAIASVMATGGSTNAVLHLLAIARDAGIPLTIEEFDKISAQNSDPHRFEARRALRRAGHVRCRRHAPARKISAASGTTARRHHRLWPEPFRRNCRGQGNWRAGSNSFARESAQERRRHRHSSRLARSRRLRGQTFRTRARIPQRPRARVRFRGSLL